MSQTSEIACLQFLSFIFYLAADRVWSQLRPIGHSLLQPRADVYSILLDRMVLSDFDTIAIQYSEYYY